MTDLKIPELLSPEAIEVLAANADSIKAVLSSGDEKAVLGHSECKSECCCPKLLKFKFVLCQVFIFNENAECPEKKPVKKEEKDCECE